MTEKLLVPDIGDFENVEVIELLVKEGQEIKKDDPVVTIESDKSSVEIPSTFSVPTSRCQWLPTYPEWLLRKLYIETSITTEFD